MEVPWHRNRHRHPGSLGATKNPEFRSSLALNFGLLDQTFDESDGELVDLDFDCVPFWADIMPDDVSVDYEDLADNLESDAVADDWFIGLQPYPNAR